ncbi:flagellin [Roseomonas sp. GC11]|uniref:flagellin n=1 Tax=Roseomonas sp. GC11 TaxID=2950546 RepID=UPI00210D9DD0|nr:flagellin [Roseomonas sp. GC11]MCQ4161979.1 flagellin [Roseomonas sp. GC11]
MANSVITNSGAKVALQSLNKINSQLDETQKKVSTGYKVADATDDGAAYAVAQKVRSDISGLNAANDQLGAVDGLLSSTLEAVDSVSSTLTEADSGVSAILTKLSDGNLDDETRAQYTEQFKSLVQQMNTTLQDASYNGTRLLGSTAEDPLTGAAYTGGSMDVTRNEKGQTYTVNASGTTADDLSFTDDISGEDLDTITSISAADAKTLLTGVDATGTAQTSVTIGTVNIKTLTSVTQAVNASANELGNDSNFVDNQKTYNSARVDSMEEGLGSLVDADLAKESARLTALQTQQQLATTALTTANSAPQSLLSLFQ